MWIIPLSSLFPVSSFLHLIPLSYFFLLLLYSHVTCIHSIVLYILPLSLFVSQGSVLEATVYGLEPYSHYSLRVEAVNNAGGFIT